jgi:pimeloyl-ACP methyl ester carboxylesterase
MGPIESVRSADGTPIAYERLGQGPPLLMVHGSTVDHTRWGGVVTRLAERFSLYLVDRRGRGASGDGPSYHVAREFEDTVAVLDAIPSPAFVLAHSYGAICVLEAMRSTSRIGKAVLYEPPLPVPGRSLFIAQDLGSRLAALLAKGNRAGVVETFLREVIHMPEPELSRLRRSASWPVRIAAAHTIPREVMTAYGYQFRAEAFTGVCVPTLFLMGGRSPVYMQEATRMASAALAGSQVVTLRGQGHAAMSTAPDLFLDKVVAFLEGTGAHAANQG